MFSIVASYVKLWPLLGFTECLMFMFGKEKLYNIFPFMQIQLKAFAIYLFHTYQSNLLEELNALYILDIHTD